MGRRERDREPTLAEAWNVLGERLGLAVEVRSERSIRAEGTVRGRAVVIEIDGQGARSEFARFLFGLSTISSRNRRETWHTMIAVACRNPSGATGVIVSAVDVHDPAWTPGRYDPRNGRRVQSDPPQLIDRVLTQDSYERLMSISDDVRIEVHPNAIRIAHDGTARPQRGATYVAGSLLHHYQGAPPPWPDRAIAGPPWWIALLCDLADGLDRWS